MYNRVILSNQVFNMRKKVHGASLLFAIFFGFSFMFSKVALATLSPIGLSAYRFLTAWVGFEILRQLGVVKIRFSKPILKSVFIVALFQPILYFLFEMYGLSMITSAEAGMMIALIPVFTSVFGMILLKEKPKPVQFVFIVLSVAGILFIQITQLRQGFDVSFLGYGLLFLSVISAALYNITSRYASVTVKPYEVTYHMMAMGALFFNLVYLIQLVSQQKLSHYGVELMTNAVYLPILYLGLIASIGGFFMVNFALKYLQAHVVSVYANISTIIAILAGAFILNESLSWNHLIGSMMIIMGVYGTVRAENRLKKVIR